MFPKLSLSTAFIITGIYFADDIAELHSNDDDNTINNVDSGCVNSTDDSFSMNWML